MRKLPPIRTWTEVVDGECLAAMARVQETRPMMVREGNQRVRRRGLYALEIFLLVPRGDDELVSVWRSRSRRLADTALWNEAPFGAASLEFVGVCDDAEPL